MRLGVHAISDGIESLLDVRELSLGNGGTGYLVFFLYLVLIMFYGVISTGVFVLF